MKDYAYLRKELDILSESDLEIDDILEEELFSIWKSIFPIYNKDIIVDEGGIEVYHESYSYQMDSIFSQGLKTMNQILEGQGHGVAEDDNAQGKFRFDLVYFQYEHEEWLNSPDWISIKVDPSKTLVHNGHFREYCSEDYWKSVLTLEDYMKRTKAVGLMDPYGVKPLRKKEGGGKIFHYGYSYPEVCIPRKVSNTEFCRIKAGYFGTPEVGLSKKAKTLEYYGINRKLS